MIVLILYQLKSVNRFLKFSRVLVLRSLQALFSTLVWLFISRILVGKRAHILMEEYPSELPQTFCSLCPYEF